MAKYKIVTRWTGYSEIEVEADTKEDACEIVHLAEHNPNNEKSTGNGLSYGYEDEAILKVEELQS